MFYHFVVLCLCSVLLCWNSVVLNLLRLFSIIFCPTAAVSFTKLALQHPYRMRHYLWNGNAVWRRDSRNDKAGTLTCGVVLPLNPGWREYTMQMQSFQWCSRQGQTQTIPGSLQKSWLHWHTQTFLLKAGQSYFKIP